MDLLCGSPRAWRRRATLYSPTFSLSSPGAWWRKEITATLQQRGIKMLLCCRHSTLASEGVQKEIGIALDLVKELKGPKFIIPLRLERNMGDVTCH
jgi:hypothetical protein